MHPNPLFRSDDRAPMDVLARRPTVELSQKKSPEERATIAAGLEAAGSPALAQLVRRLVA